MFRSMRIYFRILGAKGVLAAIKAKISGKVVFFKIKRSDCAYPLIIRIPSTDVPTYKKIFINHEYAFNVNTFPKVIVDAGANTGFASIYLANKFPETKIIAIEPEISNYTLLKKNVAFYKNIVPMQVALWNKNETIEVVDPGSGKWGFFTNKQTYKNESNIVCHPVNGMTVEKVMEECKVKKIDIFKIDIEGSEKEVFGDTSAWIEKVDSIIIELHEQLQPGSSQIFYLGTPGFNTEWRQGENIFLTKGNVITRIS
jgi:FkbM family methyltransferase